MATPDFQSIFHIRDIAQLPPFNYTLDKQKSSAGWAVLKGADGNKILVKNTTEPKDAFFYNPDISTDKGSLIKFVSSRLTNSSTRSLSDQDVMTGINWLHKINGTTLSDGLKEANNRAKKHKEKALDMQSAYDQKMNTIPLKHTQFLTKERGFSIDTILDSKFKPTLFNTIVKQDNGHIFYNTAMASLNPSGDIEMLEIRGRNFKKISLDHNKLWHSITDNTKKVDAIFLAESSLDAMAYFQIHKDRINTTYYNPIFVSTGGNIYDKKIESLSELMDTYKVEKSSDIIALYDNDKMGFTYDLQSISLFINKFHQPITLNLDDEHFDRIIFTEDIKNDTINELNILSQEYNDSITIETPSSFGQYVISKIVNNEQQLFLPKEFKKDKIYMSKLAKTLSNNKCSLYIHKAATDWNDKIMPNNNQQVKTSTNKQYSPKL